MAETTLQAWSSRFSTLEGTAALVGTGKNAGKTTVLNYLLGWLNPETAALTSLGRDGEKVDLVELQAKPAVDLTAGTLFATSVRSLESSRGSWETLEETPYRTPLGSVLILRATGPCRVEMAGPSRVSELQDLAQRFAQRGARLVLIDGAFDRVAGSASRLSDYVVLAAGSAGCVDVETAARQALSWARRFRLERGARKEATGTRSLTDEDLEKLAGCRVILPDPSGCLLGPRGWARADALDVRIQVEHPVELLGVFCSSFRPHLSALDASELLESVRRLCAGVPVYDLKLEGLLRHAAAEHRS